MAALIVLKDILKVKYTSPSHTHRTTHIYTHNTYTHPHTTHTPDTHTYRYPTYTTAHIYTHHIHIYLTHTHTHSMHHTRIHTPQTHEHLCVCILLFYLKYKDGTTRREAAVMLENKGLFPTFLEVLKKKAQVTEMSSSLYPSQNLLPAAARTL